MTEENRPAGAFVRSVVAALALDETPPRVPEARFNELVDEVQHFGVEEAQAAANDLLAVAQEVAEAGEDHVDMILAQLLMLANVSLRRKRDGLPTGETALEARVRQMVGHEVHTRPITTTTASGGQSLLAARLAQRPSKSKKG